MDNGRPAILLATQLYAPGGIQTYLRRLWEILGAWGEDRGSLVRCLSLMDGFAEPTLHPRPVREEGFSGCQGRKVTFVLRAISEIWKFRNGLVIVGHIRQAALVWMLKRMGLIRGYLLVIYGIDAWARLRWWERRAAGGAACIVAISGYTAQEFSRHNNIPLEQLRVIPPALAEDRISPPRPVAQVNGDTFQVLTVGRLSLDDRPKGIGALIQAVAHALRKGAQVKLTVVGDGDDGSALKDLALRLELEDEITFVGSASEDRLRELYQECDLFALPSRKEGFGIVFLEAMRFGKPVIGGNHGGTPEIIDHGVDGVLVDTSNVEGLAQYLVEFSKSPALRRQMGLKGYEKVRKRYLFSRMREDWFSLLDEH